MAQQRWLESQRRLIKQEPVAYGYFCPTCQQWRRRFFLAKGHSTPFCTACLTPLEYKPTGKAAA